MILKKWDDIPDFMKNGETREYYEILNNKKISLWFKRLFDIVISLVLLIILSPIFLVIAILIKIDSKGPIFYRQERVTQYGKIFKIFKFRTMVQDADKIGTLITIGNDHRITKIGNKIRKFRIDEIPQLINVLIGNMSFVGTRPEVKKYVDKYTDEMKATLLMPAGVTSKASINFKDEDEIISKYLKKGKSVDEIYVNKVLPLKMKWNLEYIKNFKFYSDVKIDIDTVFSVIN
jgi:lipopolysaccharide/colanic/teichoic acid biosynthesis glycosyltransferase